jgi:hypothetical protein
VFVAIFSCGYNKRVTTLFCAVIQTSYFADFNHRLCLFRYFIVVLFLVDVEKMCFVRVCLCVRVRAIAVSL